MPATDGPLSWTPEYRKAYYAKRKEDLNFKRREEYKTSEERRAKAREASKAYRAKNRAALAQRDREKRARSLVVRAKSEIGCLKCGYNNYSGALQWAHVDAKQKKAEPSWLIPKSDEVAFEELRKCVLLCANCHWEAGAGLWKIGKVMHARSVRLLREVKDRGK